MKPSSKAGRPVVWAAGLCVVLTACGAASAPPPAPSRALPGAITRAAGPHASVEVQSSAAAADRYARLVRSAVQDAYDALAGRSAITAPDVTVEVVADESSLETALGASPGTFRGVEATSTAAPGETAPRVWVDAAAMGRLTAQGRRIVLTHEATHVLTGVVGNAAMPLWLVEGFADYVALRNVHKPLSVTAGRILAEVRRQGAPSHLPLRADFDAAQATGGSIYTAEYEASWLACRLLAQRGGERSLVRLYVKVRDGATTADALPELFGLTLTRFTHLWQTYLRTSS